MQVPLIAFGVMKRSESVRKNLAQLNDVIAGFNNFISSLVGAGSGQRVAVVGSATPSPDCEFAVGKSRA